MPVYGIFLFGRAASRRAIWQYLFWRVQHSMLHPAHRPPEKDTCRLSLARFAPRRLGPSAAIGACTHVPDASRRQCIAPLPHCGHQIVLSKNCRQQLPVGEPPKTKLFPTSAQRIICVHLFSISAAVHCTGRGINILRKHWHKPINRNNLLEIIARQQVCSGNKSILNINSYCQLCQHRFCFKIRFKGIIALMFVRIFYRIITC
jgi:hypothetical protein